MKRTPLTRRTELARSPAPKRAKPLSASPRKGRMTRSQPKRDWADARRKVEAEAVCRVCGNPCDLEAAHVWGREADSPKKEGGKVLWVDPVRIVPLCRLWGTQGCHARYDAHTLDLLPFLTVEEQAQLVKDAGGIVSAYKRATGDYPLERAA